MKVAFATTDGINVDEHFGRAGLFAVYELNEKEYRFIELRKFSDDAGRGKRRNKRHGANP